jgi:hypothetical protein
MSYQDTPRKRFFRQSWAKPLLGHMHQTLKHKFVYLGLPGIEITDVQEWLEFIRKVIAFECREYGVPSRMVKGRERVMSLEEVLTRLEREKKIEAFVVYDGYLEEVVVQGKDNRGQDFVLNEVVTVYNLDFCNSLSEPIEFPDGKVVRRVYKTEAVRRLLECQRNCIWGESKKFVMFLTVHENFHIKEVRAFAADPALPQGIPQYMSRLGRLPVQERNARALKAYVFHHLSKYLRDTGFIPYFLPTFRYRGSSGNPLIVFTILGLENQGVASAPGLQTVEEVLQTSFVRALDTGLHPEELRIPSGSPSSGTTMETVPAMLNPVEAFTRAQRFYALWTEGGQR